MRVVIVGPRDERATLRQSLAGGTVDVVGDAATLAIAREQYPHADAFLIARDVGGSRPGDPVVEPLTKREVDVLELLAEGLPNKAIATRLAISDQTVKFHVASICGKLGAANRTDAVRLAIRRGLITI